VEVRQPYLRSADMNTTEAILALTFWLYVFGFC
jgi:hypothetical protein